MRILKALVLAALLLLGVSSAQATSYAPTPCYFGYFGANYIWGPSAGIDTADHTNVIFAYSGHYGWQDQIVAGAERGQSTVMNVLITLYDPTTMTLRPDYISRWNEFVVQLKPHLSSVIAFYHMDEPGTNAASHPTTGCLYPWQTGATPCWLSRQERMRQEVQTVNALIKQTYPQIPIMGVFGSHELFNDAGFKGWDTLPSGYDWVGFDCYGSFNLCARPAHSVPATLERLKSMMTPAQRIVLVPDGINFEEAHHYGATVNGAEGDLGNRISQYLLLAMENPAVVAIFPYTWAVYGGDGTNTLGVRQLPETHAFYTRIGKAIKDAQMVAGQNWGWFSFGLPGDKPFLFYASDGNARRPVVFRPSTGDWFINLAGYRSYNPATTRQVQYGLPGDVPFLLKLAPWCLVDECPVLFRPSTGTWFVGTHGLKSYYENPTVAIQFGLPGDVPTIIFWGTDPHIAVFRPSTNQTIVNTNNQPFNGSNILVW